MSGFDALPDEERREWLLARLGELLRRADWQQFGCTPIVLPRPDVSHDVAYIFVAGHGGDAYEFASFIYDMF